MERKECDLQEAQRKIEVDQHTLLSLEGGYAGLRHVQPRTATYNLIIPRAKMWRV